MNTLGLYGSLWSAGLLYPAWVTIGYHSHSLLEVAADNGHLSVVQLILECEHGELPGPGHWGHIIGGAAERGHLTVVKALAEELWGANRYVDPILEKTCWAQALCFAAGGNQMEIVQYFVQFGVGLDTNDYQFATP